MKTSRPRFSKVAAQFLKQELNREIDLIIVAAKEAKQTNRRFDFYEVLRVIYRAYRTWDRLGAAKRNARLIAKQFNLPRRPNTNPIRILIEAAFPESELKQKSRWVRALEFASYEETPPCELIAFFRTNGGVAGCARWAAKRDPKKKTGRSDWDDDNIPGFFM